MKTAAVAASPSSAHKSRSSSSSLAATAAGGGGGGGAASASSSSSPSSSSQPKKASPSDVIFGSSASAKSVQELGLQADADAETVAPSQPLTSPDRLPVPAGEEEGQAAAAAAATGEELRTLPANFEDAEPDDVVLLVADMLARLIAHNDTLPLHPSSLTRFHSRATPAITITSYLRRIARYTSLDKACALILLVYIDRVCERMEGFTVCSLTVHRFTCAAVVCASKALCDAFSTNGHYARVGGISLIELNMLEKEFLNIIDWRLTCSGVLLQHYYASLVRSHPSYTLVEASPGLPAVATDDAGQAGTSTDADGDAQMNFKPTHDFGDATAKDQGTWTPSAGLHADAAQAAPVAAEKRTAQQRWPDGSVNSDPVAANGRTRSAQSSQGHPSGVG